MKGYIYLAISICFEVFATTMLKFSDGFTVILPTITLVIAYLCSLFCLSHCLRYLPLSLSYAIWTGLGTVLTAVIGIVIWSDPFNGFSFIGFTMIVAGVFLLNTKTDNSH